MEFKAYFQTHADYILATVSDRDAGHFAGRVFCLIDGKLTRVSELEFECSAAAYGGSKTKAEWLVLREGWIHCLANKLHGIEREALLCYAQARLSGELQNQVDGATEQLVHYEAGQ